MHFLPFKSISVLKCTLLKVLFFRHPDGRQMFLCALKGLLSVADHNEIVSCSECCRKMATDRSFQTKAESKQLLHRVDENNRMLLSGLSGDFSSQTSFWATRAFSERCPTLQSSLKSENCMIETDVMGGVPQVWVEQCWTLFQPDAE